MGLISLKIKTFTLITAILFSVTACKNAGDDDDAQTAYDRGDYSAALRIWRPLAERSNPTAQFSLGLLYDTGEGVQQSYPDAARWYKLAAAQGDAHAQFNLALFYDNGKGMPADNIKAAHWYRQAAEQGIRDAQYNLALMFDEGVGIAKNDAEAARWYRKAAERIRIDCESEAIHNLILLLDKPVVLYIRKYLF
ncbi:MAG: sel1 repeat family protein [Xanthomonadales bacterium]|nr:sel1 repeat family protein [Xanthomonadales bacterium]